MRYKLLGKSGLRVSELCLGTMTFGEDWGWGSSKEESRKVYGAFLEAGGNFIDTANVYTNGTSEQLLGELMADHRDHIVAVDDTGSWRGSTPNSSWKRAPRRRPCGVRLDRPAQPAALRR